VAILAAMAAFYYPKGSSPHKRAGRVFIIAMLIMLISGGIAGVLMGAIAEVFLAALVSYTVVTAWLAGVRYQPVTRVLEYVALAYILIFVLAALSMNYGWDKTNASGVYTFNAIIALFFAAGDIRSLMLKGANRAYRLARHIWRISFSLAWAGLAFSDKIIKMLDSTIERMPFVAFAPAAAIFCVMVYWLFRIYKGRAVLLATQFANTAGRN